MTIDIVRAWKDEAYRSSLSTEEQALLPENPAGALELSDNDLKVVHGAGGDEKDNNQNTRALLCIQSLRVICITVNGNCGVQND